MRTECDAYAAFLAPSLVHVDAIHDPHRVALARGHMLTLNGEVVYGWAFGWAFGMLPRFGLSRPFASHCVTPVAAPTA